jgi:hypothetical protein
MCFFGAVREEILVTGRDEIAPIYRIPALVRAPEIQWSCRESNPGPPTPRQGFYERSLR